MAPGTRCSRSSRWSSASRASTSTSASRRAGPAIPPPSSPRRTASASASAGSRATTTSPPSSTRPCAGKRPSSPATRSDGDPARHHTRAALPGHQGRLRRTRARMLRLKLACLALIALAAVMAAPHRADASPAFQAFVEGLWPDAQARGVSRATFDNAFRGVVPDPKIGATTGKQSEFVRPVWHYIAAATAPGTVAKGQAAARQWAPVLAGVERTYGVPSSVVLALWGLESGYGASTGGVYTIRALATLAFAGNRRELFRQELLAALQILEQDHIARDAMLGSWAGAMGQTQFMPSSYLKFAVDGDGDGRRDIWTSVPDALASTANFMQQKGWDPSLPWGFEVVLPEGFDWRTV